MSTSLGNKTYADISSLINAALPWLAPWSRRGAVVHVVDRKPRSVPAKTPAWYTLDRGDVFVYAPDFFPEIHAKIKAEQTGHGAPGVAIRNLQHRFNNLCVLAHPAEQIKALNSVVKLENGKSVCTSPFRPATYDREVFEVLGAVQHEAAHSAWSGWMVSAQNELRSATTPVRDIAIMFEELRIEHRMAFDDRTDGVLIRALFGWLLRTLPDSMDGATVSSVAYAWGLTVGRSLTGKVPESETQLIDTLLRTMAGNDVVDALRRIVITAVEVQTRRPSVCANQLLALAQRWVDLVGYSKVNFIEIFKEGAADSEDMDEESETIPIRKITIHDPDGDDARADDSVDPKIGGQSDKLDINSGVKGEKDRVSEKFIPVADDVDVDFVKKVFEHTDSVVRAAPDKNPALANSREIAQIVFETGFFVPTDGHRRRGSNIERTPDTVVLNKVQTATTVLQNLALPGVAIARHLSSLPPGRLNMRQAIKKSADEESGRITDSRPWRAKKLVRGRAQPTKIAIMTDVSGSMKWAQTLSAEFAFVFAHAGRRISAQTAAVCFGSNVERITSPGELPTTVTIRSADDGTEMFDYGAAAIDGILNLTDDRRAIKLVLIVSDGELVRDQESTRAAFWLKRWAKSDVHVLWISTPVSGPHSAEREFKFLFGDNSFPNIRFIAADDGISPKENPLIDAALNELAIMDIVK